MFVSHNIEAFNKFINLLKNESERRGFSLDGWLQFYNGTGWLDWSCSLFAESEEWDDNRKMKKTYHHWGVHHLYAVTDLVYPETEEEAEAWVQPWRSAQFFDGHIFDFEDFTLIVYDVSQDHINWLRNIVEERAASRKRQEIHVVK